MIVALDIDGNYIHIRDVKENTDYYCPCCGGIVKPRAFKKDKDYLMQPHFYHVSGGCSEETRIHWLYKNWLFKNGSQFYIENRLYTVDHVDIEKTHNTSFGDYRPDITVYLADKKVMYFEINFTNSKAGNDYFCKWDELHNDVIEVNVKKLLNEDFNCKIPTFSLIYSDGECFKKLYQKKDEYANTIAVRKLEWKRQDKINYKIQWEKLDWFWICLINYKNKKIGTNDVAISFSTMEFEDMDICMGLMKKMKCIDIYNDCIPLINKRFNEKSADMLDKYFVKLEQYSPRIFLISWKIYDIGCVNYYKIYKLKKGIKYYGTELLELIQKKIKENENILNNKNEIDKLPYFNQIYKLFKHNNLKDDVICDIYMINDYCDKIFINEEIMYTRYFGSLKSYISKYDFQHIPNRKKIQKQDELKNEFIIKNKLKWIIKKINNSKNNSWNCAYQGYYDKKYRISISFKDEYSTTESVVFSYSDTKYEILKKIKKTLNYIIKKENKNYKILIKGGRLND